MPTNMLESLPQEILILIVEYVNQEKTYSIVDLACACKHLYYRLTPLLFRTLRFSAHNISQLAEDVQQTRKILQRVDGYSHVRRLIIDDKVRGPEKPNEARFRSGEQAQQTWRRPTMSTTEFSNHFDDILVRCMTNLYHRGDDIMSLQAVYDTNDSWEPLADFIRQISFLEGLFYDCLHQIPPCILECLHQNQPQCRLYINQFKLRSLDAHGTDNYEYSLASSPCLYGLTVLRMGLRTSFSTRWYDDEALECIVGGLAPNLKRLHMMRTRGRGTRGRGTERRREQNTPWAGFAQQTPESKITHSRGALECFWPLDWPWLGKEDLEKWESITDFSVLKILKLNTECFAIASPEHLAGKCYFPSLKELDIDLGLAHSNNRYLPNRAPAINSFMLNLPALSDLKLKGLYSRIDVDTILSKHGSRLRYLSLSSFNGQTLSLETLQKLVETCQSLETLSIQIKRSRGSHEEYIHYQTLGLLPRLRHLDLRLDTYKSLLYNGRSSFDDDDGDDENENENEDEDDQRSEEDFQSPSDPSFNEFDEMLSSFRVIPGRYARNGHIRDTFINGTLDKELAYNIYQAIYSLRPQGGHSRFVPLASMKVGVTGAFCYGQYMQYSKGGPINSVSGYLGRPCYVKRVIGSDGNLKIVVEQDPSPNVPGTGLGEEITELDKRIDAVYKRVWPAKGPQWWDNWHSFPLAKSVDEEIDWKSR